MKLGTKHWSLQRLTAIALIPLSFWLLAFLKLCLQGNYFEMTQWLDSSLNKTALLIWMLIACYHATLGLQVVLEDYVSHQKNQFIAIWTTHAIFTGLALSAVVFIFQG